MQHLQHPSPLLVHMQESSEMSPQPPTFTPSGVMTPQTLLELRHIKRQQELGNGQKGP